jgi:hypothetical protein
MEAVEGPVHNMQPAPEILFHCVACAIFPFVEVLSWKEVVLVEES